MVEWINDVPLEESIDEIEKEIGISLCEDLKNIICVHNKGQPRPNKIPLGNGKFAEFYRLLSFNKNDSLSVFKCFDDEMKSRQLLPFAMTENGNYICLKNSSVVLYSVEHAAEKFVSDSLKNFLASMIDA